MSTRQSAALPCRSVHSGHFSWGKASIALCNDWNPSLAQSSDFHWQRSFVVFGPTTWNSLPPSLRAPNCRWAPSSPTEDSAFPACMNHRPAPLWLNSEFGATYKYPDSTQLNSTACISNHDRYSLVNAAISILQPHSRKQKCSITVNFKTFKQLINLLMKNRWNMKHSPKYRQRQARDDQSFLSEHREHTWPDGDSDTLSVST